MKDCQRAASLLISGYRADSLRRSLRMSCAVDHKQHGGAQESDTQIERVPSVKNRSGKNTGKNEIDDQVQRDRQQKRDRCGEQPARF